MRERQQIFLLLHLLGRATSKITGGKVGNPPFCLSSQEKFIASGERVEKKGVCPLQKGQEVPPLVPQIDIKLTDTNQGSATFEGEAENSFPSQDLSKIDDRVWLLWEE